MYKVDKTKNNKEPAANCEMCAYNVYDEEYDCYVCSINLDEDEYIKFLSGNDFHCPYFCFYDEYKMVRRQN